MRWSRALPAEPTSVTVIKDAAGRFFASFVVQTTPQPLAAVGRDCGIDLGLAHFAVLDDGTKIAAPQFLRRAEKKLKHAQRDLCRKQKGSSNRDKARVRVARAHARMLEYKVALYGRDFRKIGRFEPTSRVCSACGVNDGPKPLHIRHWQCKACGTIHDRDVNAAKNIAALGRREAQNARRGQVRPVATAAPASEAGSRRGAA